MKKTIHLYSSAGNTGLGGFIFTLSQNLERDVLLLPLSKLPTPDPLRLQALRVEKNEIEADLPHLEFALGKFARGEWGPDAGRENGLKADIDAAKTRLRAINAMLRVGKGGLHNG
ncbi:hypothetical protein MUN81_15500 [Hymenobacter sp. 5317J-9]|uniref:hypothetical protein n=1 Tax=Hymenobacter sp. 5317J-9 TaxID=2932250 RepID=UPI001FD6931B|nr:hypothetical protein [Hymenobacter sp. 5317J-9]UOQ96641.1 hypothetical protein MUN81_15500 [Hymenobacter sp. 5317J-9]